MDKKLIIFGTGKIAEVVAYYAMNECGFDVAAFTVDRDYITAPAFCGKPVVAFEEIANTYSPDTHNCFVAVGYHNLNALRANMVNRAREAGYQIVSIVPDSAAVPSNVSYGENCFIMPPAVIHPCVSLGNNVFVWSGAMVGHHSSIGDNCWLTSGCNIGGNVKMGTNTFVAMNATIGHSVTVGNNCFLGANTLLTKHLEDDKVVIAESSKPIKLNSQQFLRFSTFSDL